MDLLAPLFSIERETDIPLIYRGKPFTRRANFPLWISLIGPSGAGKDTIKNKLLHSGQFYYIRTATNRQMRQNESSKDYIWMRTRYEGEPEDEYFRSLIQQYALFEYDYHYGNMYGTPLDSIKFAIESGKIPFYCSENQGALFMEEVLSTIFDVLTISVIPDSLEDMKKRILSGDRNNTEKRWEGSLERVRSAGQVAHFIVKNPAESVDYGKSGLESAVLATRSLILKYY
ncbi:hypothetical protein IT418_00300 [bacterium]|nr:hypothetical protein [bacterium]